MARGLLEQFGLDDIIGFDAETFYSSEYSLRHKAYTTTTYITDPQFKLHCASWQGFHDRKPSVFNEKELRRELKKLRKKRVGILAHHAHFDGFILAHHFDFVPTMYFDTLSMARPVMPVFVPRNLDALARAFGLKGKVRARALENIKGIRDLTPAQFNALARYAGDDIADTWGIFRRLLPYLTHDELRIIDLTIRMYTEPSIEVDFELVEGVRQGQFDQKAGRLNALSVTAKQLGSAEQFADLLRAEGVEPPMKVSKASLAKGEPKLTYAFSKADLAFKQLLDHENPRVKALVEARFGTKSAILEKRAGRILERQHLPLQPIYLNYWGASTGRWSGGDSINYQNLPKRDAFKQETNLRHALRAPKGHRLIIADQSQAEARLTAWFCGHEKILQAYREGLDVYSVVASEIYYKPVEMITKDERFVGKTCVLGLGYGAGGPRLADMLSIGQFGPPRPTSVPEGKTIVTGWRNSNYPIVSGWKRVQNAARTAWCTRCRVTMGPIVFEGVGDNGFIHLPNGTSLRYDDVRVGETGEMSYLSEVKSGGKVRLRTRLWGGIILENIIQALARAILARQLLLLRDWMPEVRIATTTHDEVLGVAPTRLANKGMKMLVKAMSDVPDWAKGVPFNVDSHVSQIYDKK